MIGAGFAGLGTAAMLQRRGVETRVLERSPQVANSWRNRYESLRLNTLRSMSTLRGYRMPRRYGRWPTRDQLVEYLEDYARKEQVEIEFETEARRINRNNGCWSVETSAGEIEADAVVVAVGFDLVPKLPPWPGMDGFEGDLIHASKYRDPDPFRGKDVLVVAPGNTGSEIAVELVRNGAASVRAAMRSVPNVFRREWLGIPVPLLAAPLDLMPTAVVNRASALAQWVMIGNLSKVGFGPPSHGLGTNLRERKVAPVIDAGFIDAIKAGEVELVAAVAGFEGPDVVLADGGRLQPDVVIAATGYDRGLEPLVGHLGVLGPTGIPTDLGASTSSEAPRLHFVGYETWVRGQLPLTSRDGKRVARSIARELQRS